jgi:hypothetical protein
MQLEDQFCYLVKCHTHPTGFNPLPEHEEKQALVRFMQAIYSGRGCIATEGRNLTSFYIAMSPFYTHLGGGAVGGPFSGIISGKGIMNWCRQKFEQGDTFDALLVVKAFAYVQHSLDFGEETDPLVDAFCVSMYLIHYLQRKNDNDAIQALFSTYGSPEIPFEKNKVLWCFCKVFLNIAIRARDTIDERQYNLIFPNPYEITITEQMKVTELIVGLRPDCPASHLAAYVSQMDTKDFEVLTPVRDKCMEAAHYWAVAGKEAADNLGDPLYQYLFHMIVAYWLPTTTCKTTCTAGDIREKIRQANDFRYKCESYVPWFRFFQGKQHEKSCKAALNAFLIPDETVVPKMNAYLYSSVRFNDKYYHPGGKYDQLATRYRCANCKAQLLKCKTCALCGKVYYCNKTCQTNHWSFHKKSCAPKGAAKKVV